MIRLIDFHSFALALNVDFALDFTLLGGFFKILHSPKRVITNGTQHVAIATARVPNTTTSPGFDTSGAQQRLYAF